MISNHLSDKPVLCQPRNVPYPNPQHFGPTALPCFGTLLGGERERRILPGRGIEGECGLLPGLAPLALTQRRPVDIQDPQRRGRAGGKGAEELGNTLP